MSDSEQTGFRSWLVLRVRSTRYANIPMNDGDIERYAAQLGVTMDVLLEARVKQKMLVASNGIPQRQGKKYDDLVRLQLCFPQEPWEAWQKHVHAWGVEGAVILRSLVHLYLQGAYEPKDVHMHWIWRGRTVPVVRGGPCREKTMISRGARLALDFRAAARGCSIMALLRALVLENMAGRFGRRGMLRLVDVRTMHADMDRYYLGIAPGGTGAGGVSR